MTHTAIHKERGKCRTVYGSSITPRSPIDYLRHGATKLFEQDLGQRDPRPGRRIRHPDRLCSRLATNGRSFRGGLSTPGPGASRTRA